MPDPLRVLLVSGPASGGIRRHLQSLLQGLPVLGVSLALAAPSDLSGCSAAPDRRFWQLELGDRPRRARDLAALMALRRAVREFRPEVVHAHGVKAALLALVVPLPGNTPVVVTLHNLWSGGKLTPLIRRLLTRAKVVICVSEAIRDTFAEHGIPISGARIIPNGVGLPSEARRDRSGPITVAYVGRLTREKGIDVLLEAWASVRGEGLRLLVAGDGPLRSEVAERLERLGEGPPLGHVEEVRTVYSQADLIVIPSRSEGQSLTALEAMGHGLPVIASEVGGLRQVVVHEETGLLTPPESVEALASAVRRLSGDAELRTRMGASGRERVELHFSLERMLEQTAEVYRHCAARL